MTEIHFGGVRLAAGDNLTSVFLLTTFNILGPWQLSEWGYGDSLSVWSLQVEGSIQIGVTQRTYRAAGSVQHADQMLHATLDTGQGTPEWHCIDCQTPNLKFFT